MTETLTKPARTGRGGPKRSASPAAAATVTKPADKGALVVGGVPRADLLPAEVLVDRRQRATVRRAWFGVVVVAAVVALGVGISTMDSMSSARALRNAQDEGTTLLQQQGQYAAVRDVESRTALTQAAQKVGGSTEIDWSTYLTNVQRSLPAGVSIIGVTVDSASPLENYDQPTTPLQGARVATLTFEADSPTLPSIPDWLDRVRDLDGFVDANANSVTLDTGSGHYTVNMTVHIDDRAFDGKYTEQQR